MGPCRYDVREWVVIRQWNYGLDWNLGGRVPCVTVAVFDHQRVFGIERVIETGIALIIALQRCSGA